MTKRKSDWGFAKDLENPKLEDNELETHITESGMKLNDPDNKQAWIKSDNNVVNLENMK